MSGELSRKCIQLRSGGLAYSFSNTYELVILTSVLRAHFPLSFFMYLTDPHYGRRGKVCENSYGLFSFFKGDIHENSLYAWDLGIGGFLFY